MTGKRELEVALRIKERAADALRDSKIEKIFGEAGMESFDETAGSALRALLAEKTAEYTMRAIKEARKRGMRLGAAALIIAAEKDRW